MDWRSKAACLDKDPELFFPVGNTGPALLQIEEAKAICRTCPVRGVPAMGYQKPTRILVSGAV